MKFLIPHGIAKGDFMKKKLTILIVLLACGSFLSAATAYSTILSRAKANSPQMQNAELTYQNSLLTQQQNDLDDVVQVTVSSGTVSVLPNDNSSTTLGDSLRSLRRIFPWLDEAAAKNEESLNTVISSTTNADLTLSPSVEIVLPNDGQTTITASTGLGFEYGDKDYYSVSPSVSAKHTFDLTGYDSDIAVSLSNSRTALQSEMTYRMAHLSFESQVLSSIKAILQAEQQLDEAKWNLSKAEKTLSDSLELGNMSEGSISYLQTVNQINLQKNSIAALEKQIATACEQYTTLTGLTWDGVDDLPSPDLTLNILEIGNTDVVLAGIDVQIAQQAIETKNHEINPASISVSGDVSSSLSPNRKSIGGSAAVSFNSGNWSIGTGFGGSYSNQTKEFTPSLTFAGSWTNKTTKRSDDLELQKLNNDLISAQNDLTDARTEYVQSAQNLQLEILNYTYTLQNQDAQNSYLASNLEYLNRLYEAGLCSHDEIEDAQKELEWAEYDNTINIIDGLIIENKIAQLNV